MNLAVRNKSLLLYFTSELFLSFGIGLVTYAQPFFYKQGGLSDGLIGLLFAVNALVGGITALLLGSVADRLGASRVFKAATLALSLSYLLLGSTHLMGVWLFAAAFSGFAGSMLMSTENVVLGTLMKGRDMASVLSKFVALYTVIIGSGVICSGFLSAAVGYTDTIRLGGLVALVAPLIRVFVKAPDAKARTMFKLPSRQIWAMSFFALLFGLSLSLFNPFATLVLHGSFHLSNQTTALISSVSTFTMAMGSFFVSGLVRTFGRSRTLLISFAVSITLTLVMAVTGQTWGFTSLFLVRTVFTNIPGSIVDAAFLSLTRETEYVQMFGVRVFGTNVGNAAGSYGGGLILNHFGVPWMLVLSAIGLAAAYLYLLQLLRRAHFSTRRLSDMDSESAKL